MPYTQLEFEETLCNRLRSYFNTLDNYRRASTRVHGRATPEVLTYAKSVMEEATAMKERYAESPSIVRRCEKLASYVEQHKLIS